MAKVDRSKPYDPEVLDHLHRVQLEMIQDLDRVCKKYKIPYFAAFGTALGAVRHQGFIPWDDDTDVGMLRKDYDRFLEIAEKELGEHYRILTPEVDKRYACNVTKLQRKGTVFISHLTKDLKCEQCIFIDIFPFDCVAPTKKLRKRQWFMTTFLDRLLYLCGTAYPVIPYKGVKFAAAQAICWCVHYGLRILHISPRFIYRLYVQECTRYNKMNTPIVTSFGDAESLQYKFPEKHMFPVKEVPYEDITICVLNNNEEHLRNAYGDFMQIPPKEKQINHSPYIIKFEDE